MYTCYKNIQSENTGQVDTSRPNPKFPKLPFEGLNCQSGSHVTWPYVDQSATDSAHFLLIITTSGLGAWLPDLVKDDRQDRVCFHFNILAMSLSQCIQVAGCWNRSLVLTTSNDQWLEVPINECRRYIT